MFRYRFALYPVLCLQLAQGADPIRPDDKLTPGVIATLDAAKVCRPNYSDTVRHTSAALKGRVFRAYGIKASGNYEVDHRIPLSLGGADVQANLWPESYTGRWNAHIKDALEVHIHAEVCRKHTMTLLEGQRVFQGDWIADLRSWALVGSR